MKAMWTMLAALALVAPAHAQKGEAPEVTACKTSGLLALKETSPAVKDIILDMDTFVVAKANTKVEDTPIRTVVMGEVYLEKKEVGKSQRFLCLVGEKGKVVLTFFTAQ